MRVQLTYGVVVAALLAGSGLQAQTDTGAPGSGRAVQVRDREAARAEAAHRQALAESVLELVESANQRPFDPAYRALLKHELAARELSELQAVENAEQARVLLAARDPRPTLGESSADLVYTPVPPCRVFDTRFGGGPIGAGTQRNFFVAGSIGFAGQGGNPGGCGIPFGPATSVIINFAVVNMTGPGNLRAWAVASPQPPAPLAAVMNYGVVSGLVALANGIAVPICDFAATSCASDLRLQADVSATDVVGDVVGYFRNTRREQVRSFVVSDSVQSVFATLPGGCTNAGGLFVTVVAPVDGKIVVEGTAIYFVDHTAGTVDHINTGIGLSTGDCPALYGFTAVNYLSSALPTLADWGVNAQASRVINVTAGSTTDVYLNTLQVLGGGTDQFAHGALVATFVPN